MITRTAKLHGFSNDTQPDGQESYVVRASFDEFATTGLRLDREEYESLKAAQRSGARFEVTLRVIPKKAAVSP